MVQLGAALPSCTIVKVWPPAVMVPCRGDGPKLSRTRKPIVAGPLPLLAVVRLIQPSEAVAFQLQPFGHDRLKLDSPPTMSMRLPVGASINTHDAPPCVTVKIAVATVTVPVRGWLS